MAYKTLKRIRPVILVGAVTVVACQRQYVGLPGDGDGDGDDTGGSTHSDTGGEPSVGGSGGQVATGGESLGGSAGEAGSAGSAPDSDELDDDF